MSNTKPLNYRSLNDLWEADIPERKPMLGTWLTDQHLGMIYAPSGVGKSMFAKRHKAILIVAKLDRLARNVSFVSALLDSGVDFRAADMPQANRFMIQIMSAVAEYEAQLISERTKAGLAARKARGLPMGNPQNLLKGNSPAPAMNRAKANAVAERMRPVVKAVQDEGISTVRGICERLNDRGYVTDKGNHWHPTSVSRLLKRLEG